MLGVGCPTVATKVSGLCVVALSRNLILTTALSVANLDVWMRGYSTVCKTVYADSSSAMSSKLSGEYLESFFICETIKSNINYDNN